MANAVFEYHFSSNEYPQYLSKVTHKFIGFLFLLLCASISGAVGWEDIEDYSKLHFARLKSKGLFFKGIPTHDTVARVILHGQLIAIDSKRLCNTYNRDDCQSTIRMVNTVAIKNNCR